MLCERVFNGVRIPDNFGLIFTLDYLAEMWRFPRDEIIVRFDVLFVDSESGEVKRQGINLMINVPFRAFMEPNMPTLKHIQLDKIQEIQCSLSSGALLVTSLYDVVVEGVDICANEFGENTRFVDLHPFTHTHLMPGELAIKAGDTLGIKKDLAGNKVGVCSKWDIDYASCKEHVVTDTNRGLDKYLDHNIARRPFTGNSVPVAEKPGERKHWISAVLLTRNENEYLSEWFDGNYKSGIDHTYIYDNNDSDKRIKLENIPPAYRDKVTIIPFVATKQLQYEAYRHWLENYGSETSWVTFIDTDEIYEGDLKELVNVCNGKVANIEMLWTCHNANGHIEKTGKLQSESFKNPIPYPYSPLGKMIMQTRYIDIMYVHECVMHPTLKRYKPDRDRFDAIQTFEEKTNWIPNAPVKLHHYITRSFQEWTEKIYRGSCDPAYCRKINQFFEFNKDIDKDACLKWAKEHNIPMDLQMRGIADVK